jgi:hypothetical protein
LCDNVPRYAEVKENGVGFYLKNPKDVEEKFLVFE